MASASSPRVTVIIATHNRPHLLRLAIASVRRQTMSAWRLLVMADGCDERTSRVVESYNDKRISLIHLPQRFGEQSGPNSVGMSLAETDFIALLNHDDIWLQDHLETALAALDKSHDGLFCARIAYVEVIEGEEEPSQSLTVRWQSPVGRSLRDIFLYRFGRFEPVSAWVFSKSVAERVGPWRHASLIHRTPAEDWLLRAWRSGVGLIEGDRTTIVRFENRYAADNRRFYRRQSKADLNTRRMLLDFGPEAARRYLTERTLREVTSADVRRRTWQECAVLNGFTRGLFRASGIDAFTLYSWMRGDRRGSWLRGSLRRRTGELLPAAPDLGRVIAEVRARRSQPAKASSKVQEQVR